MRLELKTNLKEFKRNMRRVHKKDLPRAFRNTINDTAFHAMRSARGEMKNSFSKVHPYLTKGVLVRKATQQHIDQMFADIYIDDYGDKGQGRRQILEPHIEGGTRYNKKLEYRLLGPGRYFYPGRQAKKTKAGRVSPAQISKAIADVGGHFNPEQNTKRKRRRYFMVQQRNQRNMILERQTKDRVVPFMVEGRKPMYRKRYDFYGVIEKVVKRHFVKYLNKNVVREFKRRHRR